MISFLLKSMWTSPAPSNCTFQQRLEPLTPFLLLRALSSFEFWASRSPGFPLTPLDTPFQTHFLWESPKYLASQGSVLSLISLHRLPGPQPPSPSSFPIHTSLVEAGEAVPNCSLDMSA